MIKLIKWLFETINILENTEATHDIISDIPAKELEVIGNESFEKQKNMVKCKEG